MVPQNAIALLSLMGAKPVTYWSAKNDRYYDVISLVARAVSAGCMLPCSGFKDTADNSGWSFLKMRHAMKATNEKYAQS